eukprot:9173039-Ditylum_brightwellii.AAC.1
MVEMLVVKNTAIYHAEVLAALIPQDMKKRSFDTMPSNPKGAHRCKAPDQSIHKDIKKKFTNGIRLGPRKLVAIR